MFLSKFILRDLMRLQSEYMLRCLISSLIYPESIVQDSNVIRLYHTFNSIPRILGIKKRPSTGYMFQALAYSNRYIESILGDVVAESGKIPEDFKLDDLEYLAHRYQYWLANMLNLRGSVTSDQVREEVKELRDLLKFGHILFKHEVIT